MIAGMPPRRTTSAAPAAAASASVWPETSPSMISVKARLAMSPASRKTSNSRALLTCCTDFTRSSSGRQSMRGHHSRNQSMYLQGRKSVPTMATGPVIPCSLRASAVPLIGFWCQCQLSVASQSAGSRSSSLCSSGFRPARMITALWPRPCQRLLSGVWPVVSRIVVHQPEQVGAAVVGARASRPDDGSFIAAARYLGVYLGPARLVFLSGKDLARHGCPLGSPSSKVTSISGNPPTGQGRRGSAQAARRTRPAQAVSPMRP